MMQTILSGSIMLNLAKWFYTKIIYKAALSSFCSLLRKLTWQGSVTRDCMFVPCGMHFFHHFGGLILCSVFLPVNFYYPAITCFILLCFVSQRYSFLLLLCKGQRSPKELNLKYMGVDCLSSTFHNICLIFWLYDVQWLCIVHSNEVHLEFTVKTCNRLF